MKKKWTVFSAWLLLVSSCLGCAPGFYETEPTLDTETVGEILDTYEAEVRMVEKMFGADLSDHTAEAYELLTEAAVAQYGTAQFDRISQLVANLTAAAWNQTEEGARGKSHAYTVAKPFGPLKGVCFWEVPVGCSMAGDLTGTVEIAGGSWWGIWRSPTLCRWRSLWIRPTARRIEPRSPMEPPWRPIGSSPAFYGA